MAPLNRTVPGDSRRDLPLTAQLRSWQQGSGTAFGELVDQVYDHLKAIAAQRTRHGGRLVTLSPTEVLHEALLGLMPAPAEFKNRAHFFATLSLAIRSILVDHARARAADKRGAGAIRVTLAEVEKIAGAAGGAGAAIDLLVIDDALQRLARLDARCGQVMHLKCFAGLDREEIAGLLEISVPTVDRERRFARAWLNKALGFPGRKDEPHPPQPEEHAPQPPEPRPGQPRRNLPHPA
jgi:RNA polymerase sigma factor (TIGR02999 family)